MPERRPTREVQVGDIGIGGKNPVRVQSMINAETIDVVNAAEEIKRLHLLGSEVVRLAVKNFAEAQTLPEIRQELKKIYTKDVPLVADVHHQGTNIAAEAAKHVEKVRVNPGLFVYHRKVGRQDEYSDAEVAHQLEEIDQAMAPLLDACKDRGVALRIGVNHGSLAERLMVMYGDTPEGMVQSALEYLRICENRGFKDVVVSLKSSRVTAMQDANRLMVEKMQEEKMNYPIHLGVTEAGVDQYARVKSSIGIGSLLTEGIGDTIRVSLAEDREAELSVCYDILQATGVRKTKAEVIVCPGCGRTQIDLKTVSAKVIESVEHLRGLTISVMGCVVNGLGEASDADYGIIGLGKGKIALYRGKDEVRKVNSKEALEGLIDLIKEDGNWIGPPNSEKLEKSS